MTDAKFTADAVRTAAEARAEHRRLTAQFEAAHALAAARQEELGALRAKLRVEEADVRRIERPSPTRLWATLRGNVDDVAARERAERDAAALAVDGARARADDAESQTARLRDRLAALGDVEARYAVALTAHEAVVSSGAGTAASDLRIIAADLGQASSELREVDEAVAALAVAMAALEQAFRSLESAGGWSTYDTFFGGGMIADLMKHSHLGESADAFRRVNRALERLRVELADVGVFPVESVQISDSLAVFDVLFDNIVSDWMVRDRIARAREEAMGLRVRLSELDRDLAQRRLQIAERLVDLARRREALLLAAG